MPKNRKKQLEEEEVWKLGKLKPSSHCPDCLKQQ